VPHPSLDWAALRRDVASYGMRNSLLTAIMPTASTAQILGNSESVDPVTTNASC
jgi:ribonucleotide reductase alpha subunit